MGIVRKFQNSTNSFLCKQVNGLSTQIENFADNLGVKIAYHAYVDWANATEPEKPLPGLDYSPNQMFWIAMANSYCAKYEPESLRDSLYTDTHAPNKFRVNGPVSNSQEFSNDFKCCRGARMNPATKCNSWWVFFETILKNELWKIIDSEQQ